MLQKIRQLLVLFSLVFLYSCEDTLEYYYGIHQQPRFFEDRQWKPVMNIFGIIRPDSSGQSQSFIFLQETFPTKGAIDKDYTLKNASVLLYSIDLSGKRDTFNFHFYEDTAKNAWSFPRYITQGLNIAAGTEYQLLVKNPGLPNVSAKTIVPSIPQIKQGSLSISPEKISFLIEPDWLSYLYEIFLFSKNSFTSKIILSKLNEPTLVEWKPNIEDDWVSLSVYAFDKNLGTYMTTATSSFYSFNVYRPPVTTVEGGMGCFGSMNFNQWELK